MVELRGVEAGVSPLRARAAARRPAYSHALLADRGALVRPELLTQLDLAVGDALLIGSRDVHDSRRARSASPAAAPVDSVSARAC